MSDEKSNKDTRTRNWSAVLYPDSLPSNWIDILDNTYVPWCVSPIHDKDIDGDGNPKKPHYHLILKFNGKKSFEQVKALLEPLNCPIPKRIDNMEGAVRYLIHLDTPHKAQYSQSDILAHNGFDFALYFRATTSARYDYIAEMVDFIAEKHITEFMDFLQFAKCKRHDTWYPLLCDNAAFVIREAIKSNRHRGAGHFIDYDAGEILVEDERIAEISALGSNNNIRA